MQTCIEQTIDLIDLRIISLQTLRESLLGLETPANGIVIDPGSAELKKTRAAKSFIDRNNGGRSLVKAVRQQRGTRAESTQRQMQAARTLQQPFRAPELARMSGVSLKAAQSSLHRWKAAGLVKSPAMGRWELTSKFPRSESAPAATAAAAPAAPAPVTAKSLHTLSISELAKSLQDCCKQRDHAREKGRDQMVDIFQRQIDEIEHQIKLLEEA